MENVQVLYNFVGGCPGSGSSQQATFGDSIGSGSLREYERRSGLSSLSLGVGAGHAPPSCSRRSTRQKDKAHTSEPWPLLLGHGGLRCRQQLTSYLPRP